MRTLFFVLFVLGLLMATVVDVGTGTGSHQVVVKTGETTTVVNVSEQHPSIGMVNEEGKQMVMENSGEMPATAQQVQAAEIGPSSVVANGEQIQAQQEIAVQAADTKMVVLKEENRVVISDSAASAEVKTILRYNETALISTESNREIKIAPSTAVSAIPSMAKIKSVELTDDGTVPAYRVSAVSSGKMFFIIPVQMEINYEIDATNGKVIREQRPWWGFLVWS